MKVFISHITEESSIALTLKEYIEARFLGQISVFVASSVYDLTPGDKWLRKIETAIREAEVSFIICSPASLTRPWINFEAGCSWIKGIEVIPICHSGQRKDQLPFPFSEFQSLQLDDDQFPKALLHALCKHFRISRVPDSHATNLHKKVRKALGAIRVSDASPLVIQSQIERTKLINDDLRTLLESERVGQETVWSSAFLSTLALGPDDPYPEDQQDYLKLLLQERELLLSLARKGCTLKFIISPANKNHIRHAGIDYAIQEERKTN